jgi:hypothetical protein
MRGDHALRSRWNGMKILLKPGQEAGVISNRAVATFPQMVTLWCKA